MKRPLKIAIVSSSGGHLTEVRCLRAAYESYPHFYVLNQVVMLPADMQDRTRFIAHSERDLTFFKNLWEAYWILRHERPTLLLSTGAGPVVPFAIVGRLFFGIHVIFVETVTRIHRPSLTGRIMYYLAHDFYYQWESLSRFFPKGRFGGALL
jgi:UDP-N-acetylglucosamine:LPS N-acetylglucosamine transferase